MTIAVCHLTPEGIVLGADSTSSCIIPATGGAAGYHFFNNAQKLFEVGEDSHLGVVTWGLGGLGSISHRTLVAHLADDLKKSPHQTVEEAAARWSRLFFDAYSTWLSSPEVGFTALAGKRQFVPDAPADDGMRTAQEEDAYVNLKTLLFVGFTIGGYCLPDRTPNAFSVQFYPTMTAPPQPNPVRMYTTAFWGVPNIILRLVRGYDDGAIAAILSTGKWQGSEDELREALSQSELSHAPLPIRDAIDYVHACISSTIKALKFSNLFQVCGGPIEIAVLTTDRKFRWVRHKPWDAGIEEGAI